MKRAYRLLAVVLVEPPFCSAAGSAGRTSTRGPRGRRRLALATTNALPANIRAMRSVVSELERKVELMELSAARYADWQACLRGVPVSEYGDPDRQFGYVYDERDGSGLSFMPALAVDRKSRPRKEDYMFLDFARSGDCRSDAPLPGGTAEPASARRRPAPAAVRQADAGAHAPGPRAAGPPPEALRPPTAGGLGALRRVGVVRVLGAR